VHEEGYRVTMQARRIGEVAPKRCRPEAARPDPGAPVDGVLTFRRPDGRVLPEAPVLAPPAGTALADTIAALAPAPWGAPGIGRLDVAFALATLRG
jgi:hypothetical protein